MISVIDIVILLIVVFGAWHGVRNGLSGEILRVVGLVGAFLLSARFHTPVADWLAAWTPIRGRAGPFLAYAVIFVGVWLVAAAARHVAHKVMTFSFVRYVESIGGCIAGAVKTAAIISVLLIGMNLIPGLDPVADAINERSVVCRFLSTTAPSVYGRLRDRYIEPARPHPDETGETEPAAPGSDDIDRIPEPVDPDQEIDLHPDRPVGF